MFFGVLISFICVCVALYLEGGDPRAFVSIPAFTIVVGGALGASLVSFRPRQLLASWRAWKGSQKLSERTKDLAPRLGRYAGTVRHKGLLQLEKELARETDPLVKLGLQMLVEGCTPEEALTRMERKLNSELQQIVVGERFFESIGGYAPTFGIIGTVMALVAVLSDLGQPERLAQGIAAAFVATFYGVLLANLVALPIACRIREHAQEYLEFLDNVYLGIQLVHRGEAPLTLVERLKSSVTGSPTSSEARIVTTSKKTARDSIRMASQN